jgi:4-amino-4-deoxy-L-arabinose transferase-like glycosyltransferase
MNALSDFDTPRTHANADDEPRHAGAWLAALLCLAFAVRLVGLSQPIVENYVGRQIPTAMVARNLERESDFLSPTLDVGPFPNRFLVEPPVFGTVVVALRRATGMPLESAGRVVSALGIVLAGWGLFGLARQRESVAVALVAVAVFVAEPVTIRYGRAFQPDALMLGCIVAGLRLLDEGTRKRIAAGAVVLAIGLALKITSAYVLVPLVFVILDGSIRKRLLLSLGVLAPAALWYFYAVGSSHEGSRAARDNQAIWLSVLIPTALARVETYRHIARFLLVRAFTPLGPLLAIAGFTWVRPHADRLWIVWGLSALAAMLALAAKLHHEYYWLSIAPVLAVGAARGLVALGKARRWLGVGVSVLLLGLSVGFSASTWKTPPEWRSIRQAAAEVEACVPRESLLVAPEALLFEADRKGCRLELTDAAARRAANEWPDAAQLDSPAALVRFYEARGAKFFADVAPDEPTQARKDLHAAIRSRYNVLVDRPGVIIARLTNLVP